MDNAERRGELLPRVEVEAGRIERIGAVRDALLAVPKRLAPRLAKRKAIEIERVLVTEMTAILDAFSREEA